MDSRGMGARERGVASVMEHTEQMLSKVVSNHGEYVGTLADVAAIALAHSLATTKVLRAKLGDIDGVVTAYREKDYTHFSLPGSELEIATLQGYRQLYRTASKQGLSSELLNTLKDALYRYQEAL